jgi:DUF2934 family protein
MLTDEKVRERAQRLWREAGEPSGRSNEFWRRASDELKREDLSPPPNLQDPAK